MSSPAAELRVALGNYVQFDSSMLPKSILNKNISLEEISSEEPKFALEIQQNSTNPIVENTSVSIMENMQENTDVDDKKQQKPPAIEKIIDFANNFGIKLEELVQMFSFSDSGGNKNQKDQIQTTKSPVLNPF